MPRARGRERMADGDAAAFDVELARSIDAERAVAAKPLAAELLRLPGFQRHERLRGESFVDLVEVEVLERQIAPPRASRTPHTPGPSAAPRRHEVHGRFARVREIRRDRQRVLGGPVLRAQQHGGRAVRQRRAVAGRQRAAGPRSNTGFSLASCSRLVSARRLLSRLTP